MTLEFLSDRWSSTLWSERKAMKLPMSRDPTASLSRDLPMPQTGGEAVSGKEKCFIGLAEIDAFWVKFRGRGSYYGGGRGGARGRADEEQEEGAGKSDGGRGQRFRPRYVRRGRGGGQVGHFIIGNVLYEGMKLRSFI